MTALALAAALAAWGVSDVTFDNRRLTVGTVTAPTNDFVMVVRSINTTDPCGDSENTSTTRVDMRGDRIGRPYEKVSNGHVRVWRIGLGRTYLESKTNVVWGAVETAGGRWTTTDAMPVARPRMTGVTPSSVTVEFSLEGGSSFEIEGSEDLRSWRPADARCRFFRAVQRASR